MFGVGLEADFSRIFRAADIEPEFRDGEGFFIHRFFASIEFAIPADVFPATKEQAADIEPEFRDRKVFFVDRFLASIEFATPADRFFATKVFFATKEQSPLAD
jgi:hypothetical protein